MAADPRHFARWPTLLAAVTITTAGLALDLADPAASPFASACLALGSAGFGAFLYAEGARMRDWTTDERAATRPLEAPRLDPGRGDPPTMPPT